jgi:endonuclease/exonuclease/phosphatase family metal-dependent hydrolase
MMARERRLLLAVAGLLMLAATPAAATELKLATWNIAWLTLRPAGDPALLPDLVPRTEADFARLRAEAQRLDADIVALQEVDGAEAAAKVFDPGVYAFFFTREEDVQRTGFAVRRSLGVVQHADLAALDTRARARRSLRRGADVTVQAGSARLRLLSIHLNAGCWTGPLGSGGARPAGRECETLAQQADILGEWAAERRREAVAFAILGDFNRRMRGTQDEMLDRIAEAGAGRLTRATEGVSDPCWAGPRGPEPFIDHILLGGGAERWFLRDSLRVLVYAERDRALRDRLSDHCPISLRLRPAG